MPPEHHCLPSTDHGFGRIPAPRSQIMSHTRKKQPVPTTFPLPLHPLWLTIEWCPPPPRHRCPCEIPLHCPQPTRRCILTLPLQSFPPVPAATPNPTATPRPSVTPLSLHTTPRLPRSPFYDHRSLQGVPPPPSVAARDLVCQRPDTGGNRFTLARDAGRARFPRVHHALHTH